MKNVNVLELEHIDKYFGGIVAAKDINIQVVEHEIYGIIGPNGAGKTTLFNMITGMYSPTNGYIRFFGKSITRKKTHEIATMGIARTFQNIRLFGDLTVFQNLLTAYQKKLTYNILQGILRTKAFRTQEKKMRQDCMQYLEDLGLKDLKDQRASNLPYGMQRRLEIARAMVTGPKILLLDEPAAGINEEESQQLSEVIKQIRAKNDITIIIIDHHMDVIMNVCDKISVINFGKLLVTGTPREIQNNSEVKSAYLGVD